MTTRETVAERIYELCKQRGITPNGLAYLSATILIVYPARVLLLDAVAVLRMSRLIESHQLCRPWHAVAVYLPEHHAVISPTADAILPKRVVHTADLSD